MTDYMITGLVKKRAELAGDIELTHGRLRELINALSHVDATLQLVAPDMELEAIRPKAFRPPDDWAKRGQMSRLVLSILRTSKEPLTTREIAAQMLLERAMDAEDQRMLRIMTKRVPVCAPGKERMAFDFVFLKKEELEELKKGLGEVIVRVRFRYSGAKLRPRFAEKADYTYSRPSLEDGLFYITGPEDHPGADQYQRDLLDRINRRLENEGA